MKLYKAVEAASLCSIEEIEVRSETTKGWWIDYKGVRRYVAKLPKKKFAHPTIIGALEAYRESSARRINLLKRQLQNEETKLKLIRSRMTKEIASLNSVK